MCTGVSLTLLAAGLTHAQTVPDAGSLLQQIERDRNVPVRPSLPKPMPPALPAFKDASATVKVRQFVFVGNTLLDTPRLQQEVAGFLDRPLNFAELQAAAAAAGAAYRRAGWIVRAYLPQQDVTQGTVTIQIVEAVFGATRIEKSLSDKPPHVSDEKLLGMVRRAQQPGAHINGDNLDRALLLIGDLPGLAVNGALAEGKREGETDLVLKVSPTDTFRGDAALDNHGSRATGSTQITASLQANSPLGHAEQFSLNLLGTEGINYLRAGVMLPLGDDGWRVGVNASVLRYRTVAPEFAALDLKGASSTAGLEAAYPLIRARTHNLTLAFNVDQKRFHNQVLGTTITDYKIHSFNASLHGNVMDSSGGGTSGSLSLTNGKLDLSGSPNEAADRASAQTAGSFSKLRFSTSRFQPINDQFSFFALWSGQLASKNLDSAESFYLGGPNGVRAYPSGEGGGAQGHLLNLELRYKAMEGLYLTGFYDLGSVMVNRNTGFPGATPNNRFSLQGAGLGVAWLTGIGATVKVTWARRIGNNPNPTASGNDQDGSLIRNRFWGSLSMAF